MSGPVIFAYAVVATERRAPADLDLSGAPPLPKIGDIQCFATRQGGETVVQEQDYGSGVPVVDIVQLAYVGQGRELPDGNVDFEYETMRLLALIQIGANAERVMHNEIDRVFEKVEEYIAGFDVDLEYEAERLERLRKEFP